MPTVSVLEYALPQRPPQGPEDDRDLSERALPRRSTSPIIGSPPVRAVPIGTPPKQMAVPSFNQQVPLINRHSAQDIGNLGKIISDLEMLGGGWKFWVGIRKIVN
jgi:hypothetical protein